MHSPGARHMDRPETTAQDDRSIDVLVVDDDQEAVEELVEYLSKANLRCRTAADGWAAVQAIRLGARDMLTKPIDGPRLVRAVKSAQHARQMRLRAKEASPPAAPAGKAKATEDGGPVARKRAALSELKTMRRLRSQYFPAELFSDPCWEMLLDLYDAALVGAEVTVTSLGAASGVPQTTALRRMETLQAHHLIVRNEDRADKRRTIIKLSDAGMQAVENFFETYLGRRT